MFVITRVINNHPPPSENFRSTENPSLALMWLIHQPSLGPLPLAVKKLRATPWPELEEREGGLAFAKHLKGSRSWAGHQLPDSTLVRDVALLTRHTEGGCGFQSEGESKG